MTVLFFVDCYCARVCVYASRLVDMQSVFFSGTDSVLQMQTLVCTFNYLRLRLVKVLTRLIDGVDSGNFLVVFLDDRSGLGVRSCRKQENGPQYHK